MFTISSNYETKKFIKISLSVIYSETQTHQYINTHIYAWVNIHAYAHICACVYVLCIYTRTHICVCASLLQV